MKHSIPLRRVPAVAALLLMLHGTTVCAAATGDADAAAPLAGRRPPLGASVAVASEAAPGASGDVAELMQLIQQGKLVELRTTYNGSYGASLFFDATQLTYYVALFQSKHFWRVIRVQNDARAEAIYADFARQTEQLADIEIRRTQLEAQKAMTERLIALSEGRARQLQADLAVARTQQAQVDERQRQMQGEAVALQAEKERAQVQLRDLQRQVRLLQRAAEAGLPGGNK